MRNIQICISFVGISARETGSNKHSASKSCALSLVRQLFHLGVIEAYSGSSKKDSSSLMTPYEVCVHPELVTRIQNILKEIGIITKDVVCVIVV